MKMKLFFLSSIHFLLNFHRKQKLMDLKFISGVVEFEMLEVILGDVEGWYVGSGQKVRFEGRL